MNTETTQSLPDTNGDHPTDPMHHENQKSPFPNPAELSSASGKITKVLFNAHSDIDGFLLDDAHQVHLHPHAASELFKTAKIGQTVIVQGVKSKTVDLLFATSITCENGTVVHIDYPPKKKTETHS
jgi:hypothetical protein